MTKTMNSIKLMMLVFTVVALMASCTKKEVASSLTWNELNKDTVFHEPYIDKEEWREKPLKHRYVHGGFKGTDTRFSFYLPEKNKYEGRFFQYITPAPDSENLAPGLEGEEDKIGFSLESGAYFVETNGGGQDPAVTAYRANAACAQYSRIVAMDMYGKGRPFGYSYGGSGGAYRTIGGIENTEGVWDGAVPYVVGSPMAIPNVFTVRMHAMRILKNKFPQIIDALQPGGSGDMYAGLNEVEKSALLEVTKMGFPPQSWYAYKDMGVHGFVAVYQGMVMADASYFNEDFWKTPGYLGADHPELFTKARIQKVTSIKKIFTLDEAIKDGIIEAPSDRERGTADMAWKGVDGSQGEMPVAYEVVDELPEVDFLGGDLLIKNGEASRKSIQLKAISGNVVILGPASAEVLAKVKVGDAVQVDNSNFLAAQTYHRHQVPGKEYKVYDQYRDKDGNPIYPQRKVLLGPIFTQGAAGSVPTGMFKGKMILLSSVWDREAFAWQGDWYRSQVTNHLGDKTDDHFRLWYTDHAVHGDLTKQDDATQVVSYMGVLQQALRDLSMWVEKDVPPPATTNYAIVDGQVILPDEAAKRNGIQPVVELTVNGNEVAITQVGKESEFVAVADLPPGSGKIVRIEWDLEGEGEFKEISKAGVADDKGKLLFKTAYTYKKPGTYFVTARIISQRNGDDHTAFARIQNLDKVRVIVK